MIEKLTPEQAARFPEFRNKWLKIGLAAKPTDRIAVEAALDLAYQTAGLDPPTQKIWLRSPIEGAICAATISTNRTQVRDQVLNQVRDQVRDQIWNQVRDQVLDQVRDQVWDQVRDQVWAQVRNQVGDQVWDQVGAQARDQVWTCGYGSYDSSWLCFYDYVDYVLGIDISKVKGLIGLAQGGWWWPFEHAVILTELPIALHRDERGRLHHPTRAAIEYADGFGVCVWHGVRVPSEWILRPDKRDPSLALKWPNVEQRRALAEMMGWERVISQLSSTIIDEDPDPQVGTLLRVDLPDSPGEQFLRVRCGTGRTFVLPVPTSCRTALEANASTYDVSPETIRLLEVRS